MHMNRQIASRVIWVSVLLASCVLISTSVEAQSNNQRVPVPAGSINVRPEKGQPAPSSSPCAGWQDDFNTGQLSRSRWTIGTGQAPGYIPGQHLGDFQRKNVSLSSGMLSLALEQQIGTVDGNPSGVLSHGGIIYTNFACGYGTYEWRMRMSSTGNCPICSGAAVSGSVSAGFLYVNNSQTEIDLEFTATDPTTIWQINWLNPNPATDPTSADQTGTGISEPDVTNNFHTYKFVWAPGIITYYIDNVITATHTTNVPSAPAYFMITHWGADGPNWGGLATVGTTRYFYVSHASYSPTY